MRITLRLDDDVLLAVQDLARRENRSAGEVLSDLARQALTDQHARSTRDPVERHGFFALPHRGSVVSNEVIDRVREEEGV